MEFNMKYFYFTVSIILLFGIIGCTPSGVATGVYKVDRRAQIMEVQSSNCTNEGGILQYENDTIRVGYVFWSEKGTLGLLIHNKLNRPIYIDWRKTAFITGSTKHDYWDENVTVTEVGTIDNSTGGSSISVPVTNAIRIGFSQFINKSSYSSITQLTKSERVTFIPPGTTIEKNIFNITDTLVTLNNGFVKDTILIVKQKNWLTGKYSYNETSKVPLLIQEYNEETTPIAFRSFITYSLDEKFSVEAYVNTSFFISKVIQLPLPAFDAKKITDPKEGTTQNIWINPHAFYVLLEKYSQVIK